jgi:DnaJ like chaperone protein
MNIWGKLIGAASGFALGGPEGTLVGALAGHFVDMYIGWAEEHVTYGARLGRKNQSARQQERRNAGSRYQFTLLVVTLAAKLAKSDGPVVRAEISAFKEVFKVPPEETRNVGRMFDKARASASGYESSARQLAILLANNKNMLDEIVGGLFHVAIADGPLHTEEVEYIRTVARIFGFSESYFQRRLENYAQSASSYTSSGASSGGRRSSNGNSGRAAPSTSITDPYAVLGVSVTSPDKDIKIKYRKLVRENHPDMLSAAGKSKAMIDQATAKLARINAAYDLIQRERERH